MATARQFVIFIILVLIAIILWQTATNDGSLNLRIG